MRRLLPIALVLALPLSAGAPGQAALSKQALIQRLLKLTKAGLAARDELVLGECRRLGLPVAIAMAGGYARNIDDTVDIHAMTVTAAARLFRQPRAASL